jgi:autotransporter-associated beta strand protein
MKTIRFVRLLIPLTLTGSGFAASGHLPAFPGAEGFGSIATGGRGGDVYYVTNLASSGAGSFAYGVQNAPVAGRTVIFAVSGHIRLPSGSGGGLTIAKSNITVAGQTAPGDGICFWNNTMNLTGNDIVLRNIRWRYGYSAAGGDSVDIANSQRIILDHCDVMFSTDENLSSFGTPPEFFTFQWSVNAWGLNGHSCGGLWDINHATAHHTLWANNHTRNPKCISPSVFDWVNNVTFGWDNGFNMAASTDPVARVNIRGSYFIHGGNTTEAVYGGGLNTLGDNIFKLHMSDSALDGTANGLLDVNRTNYGMVSSSQYDQVSTAWPQTLDGITGGTVIGTPVSLDSRRTAHKKVLSQAGATRMEISTRPLRDEITQLCVDRTAAMQRGIISNPLELGLSTGTAFANLQSDTALIDTDLDGMPDDWEEAVGHNKTVANNNTVLTAPQTAVSFFPAASPAGYTQLEEYLHFKAVAHGTVARNTTASPAYLDIDLRKFTSGFTASPVFSVSNITNGTVTQSGPGNAIVRFTPPLDTSGRAGFLFTVTDAAGDSWTQQCCLLISTKTQPRPITWVGDGTINNWDTATANFSSFPGPAAFATGDAVTINDTGSNNPTIKVIGALSPASLTVSNTSKNFTIQGTGSLAATDRFAKSGTGTLTISNTGPNTFTGSSLEAGTLSLTTANALGSAPINFTGGTLTFSADQSNALVIDGTVTVNPTGSRTMNGAWSGSGTINLTNTGSNLLTLGGSMANFTGDLSLGTSTGNVRLYGNTGSTTTAFDLGTSTVTLHTRNGGTTINLGSLTGSSGTKLSGASSVAGTTTFSVGATNASTIFAGSITNGSAGPAALTKTGTGILTLTGNSTHTAATAVNTGSLALLGTFGTTPVTVAANATLSGIGTMGGSLTTSGGAILSPGADNGTSPDTLTAASLNLTSPNLRFDLSNNPISNNDRIQVSGGGAVSISGTQNFIFNLTDGNLSPGTYDLITTTGTLTATSVTLTSNLPTGSRQTLTLEHSPTGTAPGYVRLVVTGTNANLTWTGTNGGLWDQQNTAAWSGASPATFFNFDSVAFTDTASSGNVTITQPVAPQSITVNNTAARPYTFTGAPITGTTSFVKSGSGALTLNVPQHTLTNCTLTTGSPTVAVSSTVNLFPGMTIIDSSAPPSLPTGTTILAVVNATTLTLSQNATATSTTDSLIFETRNTFSGGTILNAGSLTLACNSWQYYSSPYSSPSNAWGLGTGPITLNGGTLTLLGHTVDTRYLSGALPNDLIVPAGKTATLRSTMRGTSYNDIAGLRGSLTGSGTLNLVVNYAYGAIVGDWSAFAGTLNVTRPTTGANGPLFQLGNDSGLPLANVSLDQVTLTYSATPPTEGIVIPIGSLSGTDTTTTLISGAQTSFAPVTWRVGGLNTSNTFAGNFTQSSTGGPIGLAKTGSGIWTLTGPGTVSAGISVEQGTLSYGDAPADTLSGTSEISVNSGATLQLNNGAKIIGSTCEVFTGGTLRGLGTLQAPLNSSGTVSIVNGTLSVVGDTNLSGTLGFSALTDRLAVTGNLDLRAALQLPSSGLSIGRKLLATHTGTLNSAELSLTNIPTTYFARIDTATPGEVAVRLIDSAAYQSWQITHFGSTSNPDGQPSSDPDGDGITNFEEFENGTNPNDHLPLILTISSNNAASTFSSLSSAYPGGILTWTDGGLLTNRAVHRLILDTTLTGGTIDLGAPTNVLTLTSGEIQFLGTNNLVLTGGQLGANNSAVSLATAGTNTLTLASPISGGTGSLTISGTANVILNSANTFTGGLTLNVGNLKQGVANSLGSANGTLTLNSGTLDLNGIATGLGTLTGTGGFITSATATTLTLGNNNATGGNFAGSISGSIALTKTGTGIQTLSGNNPYTGLTTVSAGTLRSGADNAIGNGDLTLNGGTLDLQTYSDSIAALTLTSGTISGSTGLLTANSYSLTSGNISARIGGASAALAKSGSAYNNTATLSGANTYGGATTLGTTSGSIIIAHNDALGNTPAVDVIGTGAALVLADGITVTGKPVTVRGTGANNNSTGSFGGSLTTNSSATATWTGSVTLGDTNGRLGAGTSGTLNISGPILGSGANQSLSLSSGSGATIGTVVLSGANNFTGNLSIVRGNLKLGAANTLPATAIIDVGSATTATENTTFDLNGFSQTLAGLKRTSTNTTQVSTVTNSSATPATLTLNQTTALAYSGRITGNLILAKSGAGTLTLSNANALATSLSVMLDAGALSLSSSHTITALRINGIWQAAGTYNSANSSTRISGSGSLIVTTNGPTGFQSWIDTFSGLTTAQKLPAADPDNDGVNNLLEYVLNGIPNIANPGILPTPSLTPTRFVFTFTRREESATTTTQIFEYASTLGNWTPVNITAPTAAEVSLGPLSGGIRTVTVNIPRTSAPDGKLFGRLKVSQP